MEEISGGHPVQSPAQSRANFKVRCNFEVKSDCSRWHPVSSVLTFSRDGAAQGTKQYFWGLKFCLQELLQISKCVCICRQNKSKIFQVLVKIDLIFNLTIKKYLSSLVRKKTWRFSLHTSLNYTEKAVLPHYNQKMKVSSAYWSIH